MASIMPFQRGEGRGGRRRGWWLLQPLSGVLEIAHRQEGCCSACVCVCVCTYCVRACVRACATTINCQSPADPSTSLLLGQNSSGFRFLFFRRLSEGEEEKANRSSLSQLACVFSLVISQFWRKHTALCYYFYRLFYLNHRQKTSSCV